MTSTLTLDTPLGMSLLFASRVSLVFAFSQLQSPEPVRIFSN